MCAGGEGLEATDQATGTESGGYALAGALQRNDSKKSLSTATGGSQRTTTIRISAEDDNNTRKTKKPKFQIV